MKHLILSVLTVIGVIVSPLSSAEASTYKIDPAHTHITFKVKHLGISSVKGAFNNFEGTFTFDPEAVEKSSAKAMIKTKSIDTDNEERDEHLRSADFLNAEKQPEITFVSKEIKEVKDGGKQFTILGDLTINGVTKPVELETEFGGAVKDPWGNERAAFLAKTSIDRKEFGVAWNKLLETGGFVVGEDVHVEIAVEGIKK